MKRTIITPTTGLLLAACGLICAGCFSAKKQANKALDRVNTAERAAATNQTQQVSRAAALVHGTGRALSADTNRSPATMLAYDLNSRAGIILGSPRYEDALTMDAIVRGALSPLIEEQQRSASALARIDGQVTALQSRMSSLQGEKAKAEDARDQRFLSQAEEVDVWRRIKRWLLIGGGLVGLAFLAPIAAKVLSVLFPIFSPITQIFAAIIAWPGKLAMRLIPEVGTAAGVIAKETHDIKESAALALVGAIETLKTKDPDAYAKLRPVLLAATDTGTRGTISSLKPVAPRVKV